MNRCRRLAANFCARHGALRTAAVLLAGASCAMGQVSLSLASGSALTGSPVALNLSMITTGQPAGLEWTLSYSATDFSSVSVVAGPAAVAAGKSVSCNGSPGSYTCLLSGLNTTAIANGVVATATFTVSPSTTNTLSPIQVANDVAVSGSASALSVTATSGQVSITQAYSLTGLTCTPATVTTPGSAACTASVSSAAPTGGLAVATGVGGATGITIPSSVTVAAGSTSAGFSATASTVSTSTTALLVASLNATSKNFTVTLAPPATATSPAPSSVTCNSTTLAPNTSDTCTINLTSPAPTGGVTVALTVTGSGLAAPSSVSVPAGSSSAQFNVQAGATALGSYTISASVQGVATTASISLSVSAVTGSGTGGSGTGGWLSDIGDGSAALVNLTTEGATDWVHWGEPNLNRKAGVAAQLSTYNVVGTGQVSRYNNDPRPVSWTDGNPKPKTTGNTDGVYIAGVGNGFSFTAPADTTMRTLTVHVGGWNSSGTLTAHLSDGSSPDSADTTIPLVGQYDRNYTLTYRAATAGQTLKVTWKLASGTGNVTLNAAALQ
ncbi:MAG TPA: hypothetical protein VEU62_24160 [Bryobacterales bacterium]|nr:hypothetical protein [Bryobacterales bacterium]